MRLTLTSLIRAIALAMLALTVLAAGLGRMTGPPPRWREVRPVESVHVTDHLLPRDDDTIRLLDAGGGPFRAVALPAGDHLQHGALSPWCDERGGRQVAGVWSRRSGRGSDMLVSEVGLGRFRLPDG